MSGKKRELPLMRRRIEALLLKTFANGCTEDEAVSAFAKAKALVFKYGIDPGAFRWPQRPSASTGSASSGSEVPRPSSSSDAGLGKSIGRLAESLLLKHPEWSHTQIADAVNQDVEGARATAKSVRRYASRMRARGEDVPTRRRSKHA